MLKTRGLVKIMARIRARLGPHYLIQTPPTKHKLFGHAYFAYVSLRGLMWLSATVPERRGSRPGRNHAHCLIGQSLVRYRN